MEVGKLDEGSDPGSARDAERLRKNAPMSPRRPPSVTPRLLLGVILAGTLSVLDSTIVVPLLSAIGSEFGGGSEVSWLVAAYLLASTVAIPLWGRWMDLRGERAPMWAALALFVAGTVLCALAPGLPVLILGRTVQGIGAGGMVPLGQAILAARCTSEERARLQVYYNIAYGMAAGLGPLIGGALLGISWRWAFWFVLPFAVAVAIALAGSLRGAPRSEQPAPFDWWGSAVLTIGLTVLLIGVERKLWSLLIVGIAAIAAYVVRSRRHRHGVVPRSLLTSRVVMACAFVGLVIGFVQFSFLTYLPTFALQLAPNLNSGLVVVPLTVLWMTLGAVTGVLALRIGTRILVLWAAVSAALAGITVAVWSSMQALLVASALVGVAAGLALIPVLLLAQLAAPREDLGAVTSTMVLMRNFGGALGVALTAVVLAESGRTTAMWMLVAVAACAVIPWGMLPVVSAEQRMREGVGHG